MEPAYSFTPHWRPPFISALAPDDRCHLNGLAMVDDRPRYVTALGTSDSPQGWRTTKATVGVLLELCQDSWPSVHGPPVFVFQSCWPVSRSKQERYSSASSAVERLSPSV